MPAKKEPSKTQEILVFQLYEESLHRIGKNYGTKPVGRVKTPEDVVNFGPGLYALFVGTKPPAKLPKEWKLPGGYKFQGVREVSVPIPKPKIKEIA